ncbi:MAG: phosphotransferase [Lachnospiraceae bacterium]|nr:phosphotransferase [Lachnospiraceae bacterium]
MTFQEKDGKVVLALSGRIDTNNAADTEKEITEILSAHQGMTPAFDAGDLAYISSAGLRVLMKVRKEAGEAVEVFDVSPEVYDIFETTGFTQLLTVRKKLRTIDIAGCEKIGEGGNGAVYRIDDDKIVKVYKPWIGIDVIERERNFARTAFVNGIPSVIAYDSVQVGDCRGIVFELLHSDTLGHAMSAHPEKLEEYVNQYVALAKTLHSAHVPKGSFTPVQELYHSMANNLGTWCSDEEIALLHSLIDEIPEADTVTHNDLHPGNIMLQDGELVLIDMQEVTMGPPICDLTSIYRDMIVAPKRSADVLVRSVGMPADLIAETGEMFFRKYTGLTDQAEIDALYQRLGLLYAFNVALIVGNGSEGAMKRGDMIMDNLLRPIVIPNEQAIRMILRSAAK